jgi:hypothetical protein
MVVKPPSISLNKLAEFMTANPARQRQILKDQKYPTEFKGMYYKDASESIGQVIAGNLEDLSPLSNQKAVLEQITTDKVGTNRRIQSNIDAIEGFEAMLDQVKLVGAKPTLGSHAPQKLARYGVLISVRPDIMLSKAGKAGPLIGAIKLHFSRQFPLTEETSGIVSAVIQEWCRDTMPDSGTPLGELSFVIDVGARTAFPGVKSIASRLKQVDACCQNIASLWPGI